ncbi:MAG: copper-translocating P-type ATPase [Micromonosporaceae bacterium]|nr:copper-translocating P-type ATPase [Micromonosporaceae bacterium]
MSGTCEERAGAARYRVELAVGGMTCASCAARTERTLNQLDGVVASVNFATETATVTCPETTTMADLVRAIEAIGYTATPVSGGPAGASAGSAPQRPQPEGSPWPRLAVSGILTVPVLALSMVPAWQFDGWQWLVLLLATPVVTWGAWPFHRAALVNLRHGVATMDTLISLGVVISTGWSLSVLAFGSSSDHIYLEVGSTLTTFLLAGRVAEARAKRRATSALRALLALGAKDAVVLRDGNEVRVGAERLVPGDLLVVRPGEKIATDGVVVEGTSALDESMITGESVPADAGPGRAVVGATVNLTGRLVIRATRVGADTYLAQLARLVTEAQSGKAPIQRLADRISAVFVPAVIAVAGLVFAGRLVLGQDSVTAITAGVAVLIVACPCALGLATPMALLVGTGRGAHRGIVIRGPEILESTRRIDTVVLDKTGTITTGLMELQSAVPVEGQAADDLLRYAGAVEHASEHPVAAAIAAGARLRLGSGDRPSVTGFAALPGLGARGSVNGHDVLVGQARAMTDSGHAIPEELASAALAATESGRTGIFVAVDGEVAGLLTVADTVRPNAAEAIASLRDLGLRPVLLTGDHTAVARSVAGAVGIDEVIAEVLPEGKVEVIQRLQTSGRVVAMVGDGINDAAALACSDLGIAMGTGTDIAIEASDLTLVRSDLAAVADAIGLSRATLRTIKGNLFWAFAYNVAAIPLAAAGLVAPVLAAAAMASSSLFVVGNSLRLFRWRPAGEQRGAATELPGAATRPARSGDPVEVVQGDGVSEG